MSFPTLLGPWYVVQRLLYGDNVTNFCDPGNGCTARIVYYMAVNEADGPDYWTTDPTRALLFMSLASAARVAEAEVAEVRVLSSKEDAKPFGRD